MTDGTIDRDGVAIHYEVHGAATARPPLLLSHGYAASTSMWGPNLAALSADRQVVAWDLRGHGRSDAPADPAAYSEDAALGDAEARAIAFETDGLDALGSGPEVAVSVHDPLGLALAARGILTQHDDHVIASLPSVRVPTLVIVGDQDEPFRAAADYMATKIPGADRVVVSGAGHAANLDQPEAFNAAVRQFLDRLPA